MKCVVCRVLMRVVALSSFALFTGEIGAPVRTEEPDMKKHYHCDGCGLDAATVEYFRA